MEQDLQNTIALLARFPKTVDALLRDQLPAWTLAREGDETWNAFDVIGHLVHLERAHWMTRVRHVLESGDAEPFTPVDRWAQTRGNENRTLEQLLDEFSRLRSENLRSLHALNLSSGDLSRSGRHPAFGTVTLSEVLATWVVHDLTHLHQISRILAVQYREAVGPWQSYLGVLKCAGHSD